MYRIKNKRCVLLFFLTVGIALIAFSGFATAETIYSEGFEDATPPSLPTGCWWETVNGNEGSWRTATSTVHPAGQTPHGGNNLAYFNSYTASSGTSTRLRLGTALDLSDYENLTFYVWMYHDTQYSNADNIQVQVSIDGGTTWEDVGDPIPRYDTTTGWAEASVDLSDFDGENEVFLGIVGNGLFGNDIHIDDLSLEGDFVGDGDSDSSSGCNTGAMNPMFLLLLAPMGLLLRKSR